MVGDRERERVVGKTSGGRVEGDRGRDGWKDAYQLLPIDRQFFFSCCILGALCLLFRLWSSLRIFLWVIYIYIYLCARTREYPPLRISALRNSYTVWRLETPLSHPNSLSPGPFFIPNFFVQRKSTHWKKLFLFKQ